MLINNLYNTKLFADKSTLGLGETATITIVLTDFNGNPLSNKQVTLNYGKSSSTRNGVASLSVKGNYTTNSEGKVTVSVSESTPMRHIYECNGKRIELKWDGWFYASVGNFSYANSSNTTTIKVYESLEYVRVVVNGKTPVTTSWVVLTNIEERFRPYQCVSIQVYYGVNTIISVRDTGDVVIRDLSGSWTPDISPCEICYAKR